MSRVALLLLNFIVFVPIAVHAQLNVDSLKVQVEKQSGLSKASTYHELIMHYYRAGEYDSALLYANDRVEFAKHLDNDSTYVESVVRVGQIYDKMMEYDEAREYFRRVISYSQNNSYAYGEGHGNLKIALSFYKQLNFDSSIYYSQKAEKLFLNTGHPKKLSVAYTGMGNCYLKKGDLVIALDNYFKSLKIDRELGDTAGMASSYQNIGAVYYYQDEEEEALRYFLKALKLKEKQGNEYYLIGGYHNVGAIYKSIDKKDSSLFFYSKALALSEKLQRPELKALSLTAIGSLHLEMKKYDSARIYLNEALQIQNEIEDEMNVIFTLREFGVMEAELGSSKSALEYLNQAKHFGEKQGFTIELLDVYQYLFQVNEDLGDFREALENYKKYVAVKDTLFNEEVQEKTIKMDMQYHFDKEVLEDSLTHAKERALMKANAEKQDAEIKASRRQKYMLFGGMVMIITFLVFVFNRLKVTKKQKALIETQKQQVEETHELLAEHHKEIQDSINYAKRIQSAILPTDQLIREYLKDSFVLYKPKDIVAGDFYWLEPREEGVVFAAADCTGHGVPGAMVSVVCNNGLNRSVREFGLTDPGAILDKTREIVVQEFEKGDAVKDGMDIALCYLKGRELLYAGAHNPLWIIRKGSDEIEEIKADKEPIGKYDQPNPYTTHTIQLNSGDSFYIFSDGYADQFGGDKGKKLKTANFKKLLLSIQDKSMSEQRLLIDDAFETWRGSIEQIDDVCVIGVKI